MEMLDLTTNNVRHCNATQVDEYITYVDGDEFMPGTLATGGQLLAEKDLLALNINTWIIHTSQNLPSYFKYHCQ
eukprot:15354171-Ditylum_brightwellii.AAC.1